MSELFDRPADRGDELSDLAGDNYDLDGYPDTDAVTAQGDETADIQDRLPEDLEGDTDLDEPLRRSLEAVGPETTDALLAANAPYVGDPTDSANVAAVNKLLLDEIPALAAASERAELPIAQATEIATHAMASVDHPETDDPDRLLARVTQAIDSTAGSGLPPEAVVDELKGLVDNARDKDVVHAALRAFAAGRSAGLSVTDSVQITKDYIDTGNARLVGYNMWRFTDALGSLKAGGIDPELTKTVFRAMADIDLSVRDSVYTAFQKTVTFGCPYHNMTPTEMLKQFADKLQAGVDAKEALERCRGDYQPSSPSRIIERRFTEKPGRLEHAALSYKTTLPLNEGIHDLAQLTEARLQHGETVAEGAWVFDPATSTWYSLGGESSVPTDAGISHRHASFDISYLSATPYQFHIHPSDAGRDVDKLGFIFPTGADLAAIAQQCLHANRPMELRSFIQHPLGTTEVMYPDLDLDAVRRLSNRMDSLKSEFFASISPDENEVRRVAQQMGEREFANACVQALNRRLPVGFYIRLFDHNVDLEDLLRAERQGRR